jgi:hypothetical protein
LSVLFKPGMLWMFLFLFPGCFFSIWFWDLESWWVSLTEKICLCG